MSIRISRARTPIILVALIFPMLLLSSCSSQPETVEVEVTRIITETQEVEVTRVITETETEEVEVTRVVEVEVPVTRIVDKIVVATATPLPPTSTPENPGQGERDNPVPLGVAYPLLQIDNDIAFELTMLEAVRGEDAQAIALNANQFNENPDEGWEWVLVKAGVNYTGEDNGFLEIDDFDLDIVSNGALYGRGDTKASASGLNPDFSFEMLAGGSGEGWFGWHVPIDDNSPMVYIGDNFFQLFE